MPHEATPAPLGDQGIGIRDRRSLSKLAPSIVAHTMIIADRTPPRKRSHPRHVLASILRPSLRIRLALRADFAPLITSFATTYDTAFRGLLVYASRQDP